ncbi:MAG TPA: hypothetical protein VE080_01120 [Candidatus Aquicultoraceae bacterium]|nr:hypothetical protein [Candidatus Aquicultoraceae bacterium]
MEVILNGTEVHALRELVEEAINALEKEIKGAAAAERADVLKTREDIYRKVLDKLPIEFGTLA